MTVLHGNEELGSTQIDLQDACESFLFLNDTNHWLTDLLADVAKDSGYTNVKRTLQHRRRAYFWMLGQLEGKEHPTWNDMKKVDLSVYERPAAIEMIASSVVGRIANVFKERIHGTPLEQELMREYESLSPEEQKKCGDEETGVLWNYITHCLEQQWNIPGLYGEGKGEGGTD